MLDCFSVTILVPILKLFILNYDSLILIEFMNNLIGKVILTVCDFLVFLFHLFYSSQPIL